MRAASTRVVVASHSRQFTRRVPRRIIRVRASTTDMSEPSPAARAIDFLHITQALKTTPRTGWVNHGVDKPESIADHMYRMSLMAMVAAKSMPELDQDRCVKLALIHDLAEAIVGDITPHDPVTKEEKAKMESDAMAKIRETLGDALGGEEVEALWHEYEEGVTPEAKLLKVRTWSAAATSALLTRRNHRNPDGSRAPPVQGPDTLAFLSHRRTWISSR